MKYLLIMCIGLTFACSGDEKNLAPVKFPEGVYVSMLYAVEATGKYSVYEGNMANLILAVTIRDGEWQFCSNARCFDPTEKDGVMTGVWKETDTFDDNGILCEYTAIETYSLSAAGDNKIDGWNIFSYHDCNMSAPATIDAYAMGVDIKIFH